ncbi:LacI family DNA-binding transcriptional regulator [Paenarthrobacter ureafaciens]|uniref:LacI family DNA-binding transcriptional regulator n=1 Tax=Paenarthrobacter ureafaciens TaxID=37931 RepID=UPI0034640455
MWRWAEPVLSHREGNPSDAPFLDRGQARAPIYSGRNEVKKIANRISIVDVAALAGVPTQTVSRVAKGSPNVRAATRRHVIAAMNELRYRPNSAARALQRGSFRTIEVITFSLSSLGNTRTLEAIALHAARQDFAITLIPCHHPHPGGHPGCVLQDG